MSLSKDGPKPIITLTPLSAHAWRRSVMAFLMVPRSAPSSRLKWTYLRWRKREREVGQHTPHKMLLHVCVLSQQQQQQVACRCVCYHWLDPMLRSRIAFWAVAMERHTAERAAAAVGVTMARARVGRARENMLKEGREEDGCTRGVCVSRRSRCRFSYFHICGKFLRKKDTSATPPRVRRPPPLLPYLVSTPFPHAFLSLFRLGLSRVCLEGCFL